MIRVVAGLRDQLQPGQRLEERRVEACALAQCDQYRVSAQPLERLLVGVHIDRDAAAQALNRRVGPEDAMVVVQHGDPHIALLVSQMFALRSWFGKRPGAAPSGHRVNLTAHGDFNKRVPLLGAVLPWSR